MKIERGSKCYEGYSSISCDYCGREDIHGEVWHCPKGYSKDHVGYNLCRTCGHLIPRQLSHKIKRPGPPEDDLGLLVNQKQRSRFKTSDGFNIYKWEEVKKELKIGIGGGTPLCPFDCECCF